MIERVRHLLVTDVLMGDGFPTGNTRIFYVMYMEIGWLIDRYYAYLHV